MKNLLIIYNVIFLLFGNVLLSNIHYLHDHDHNHDITHEHENHNRNCPDNKCQECIIFESTNNCILDFQELNFSNNNINEFIALHFIANQFVIDKKYSARSPPNSCK